MKFEYTDGTKDLTRIIKYLNYPPLDTENTEKVRSQMKSLEKVSGDFVERTRQILDDLDQIEALIVEEFNSPNFALTQADVLKYAEGKRAKGMLMRKWEQIKSLGKMLNLKPEIRNLEDQMEMIGVVIPHPYDPISIPLHRS